MLVVKRERDREREGGRERGRERKNHLKSVQTYHPVLQNVRKILEKLHIILVSDDGHKKLFSNLKAYMVRSKLPHLDDR